MKKHLVLAAAALAVTAMAGLTAAAKADVRLTVNRYGMPYFETYYPDPYYLPPPPPRWKRQPPPAAYDSAYYDDYPYGDPRFDESYYDPYYLPPSRGSNRDGTASTRTRSKLPATASAPGASGSDPLTTGSVTPRSPTVASAAAKSSGGAVSCDKALKIVSGYGFSSVKSTDCEGQVYEFSATRDGKNFAIKLSAASGELTEVKKVN